MFLRSFLWYRKLIGGSWYFVSYSTPEEPTRNVKHGWLSSKGDTWLCIPTRVASIKGKQGYCYLMKSEPIVFNVIVEYK